MSDAIIAFRGSVILEKAVWDNQWGMYSQFSLPSEQGANPFKKYTKMKKGKVGTRFSAVLVSSKTHHTAYENEVMLKGWSDGTSGNKLTLWHLGTEGLVSLHPFMEYEKGEEFAMALVELDDDDEAINQVKRDKLLQHKKHKQKLSNYAAQIAGHKNFWRWIAATQSRPEHGWDVYGKTWPDIATAWIKQKCVIQSRSELDSDAIKAQIFHSTIREPYRLWLEYV